MLSGLNRTRVVLKEDEAPVSCVKVESLNRTRVVLKDRIC